MTSRGKKDFKILFPELSEGQLKLLKQLIAEEVIKPLVGPRCKTKDTDDFPELKNDERCLVCEAYESLHQLIWGRK